MLNSRAVFSSGLCACARASEERVQNLKRIACTPRSNVHLSATEDEALLRRRNTRLLLDFLLDPSDLRSRKQKLSVSWSGLSLFYEKLAIVVAPTCLIVKIDVKFNLARWGFFISF
jgi:hypothetical protein